MRSRTSPDLAGHCPRCYLRLEICLCAELRSIHSHTEIIIVRHVAEARLTSNTGRLAALALKNCRILDYGGGLLFDDATLYGTGTWLLYPGRNTSSSDERPTRLVVLDGTFQQARRMYTRIPALRSMPELALPAPEVAPIRLRKPTRADGMSTLEAIAAALHQVDGPEIAAPLLALQAALVKRVDALRGRRRAPLTNAS